MQSGPSAYGTDDSSLATNNAGEAVHLVSATLKNGSARGEAGANAAAQRQAALAQLGSAASELGMKLPDEQHERGAGN